MDGTFKIVGDPFTQLFAIHAFVREEDETKQVPLLFVLMSNKNKQDYIKVLRHIVNLLPRVPAVTTLVMDYESGLWPAVKKVFPGKTRRGCAFHWKQAVYKKIQKYGLHEAYCRKEGAYQLLRNLMGLNMLPAEHVRQMFEELCQRAAAANDHRLDRLTRYMRKQWFDNPMLDVKEWVVFKQPVRTNNDTEGWHRRIKKRAGRCHLGLYLLIHLMKEEADFVHVQVQQVSYLKLKRHQRKLYREAQGKLFKLWKAYEKKKLSTTSLLKACTRIYKPVLDC